MRKNPSSGFTLIEMLAATVLAVLLTAATLAALGSIGREAKASARAARRDDAASGFDGAVERLRWDLTHARRMNARPDSLTLTGFGSLDPATLAPTHRPVRVVYRVGTRGGRAWLVREQTSLDVAGNRNAWSDLVCAGAAGFRVERPAGAAPAGQGLAGPSPATRPGARGLFRPDDGQPVPDTVVVTFEPDAPGEPAVVRLICVR